MHQTVEHTDHLEVFIEGKTFHWSRSPHGWAVIHRGPRAKCIYCPRIR